MKNNTFKHISDEELVRLYVESQRNSYFEELYDRYSDKVYRKCVSFVKNQAQAEDYTHDIFLRLVLKIGSFKENSKFSTWLYSITYNYCMDQLRIAKRHGEVAMADNFDFEEEVDDKELLEIQSHDLNKALDKISAEEKAILLMKYQDDFSIKEIADTFNLTESAVKMRLMRTKEKVKKLYLDNIVIFFIILLKILLFWKE